MIVVVFAVGLILAYLIGSVPFGLLIARAVAGVDIRTVGSGNIGATNVGRTLGFRYFLAVTLLDAAKGFVPTFVFPRIAERWLGRPLPDLGPLVALAAVLGHSFPVYLGFRGGKGVATTLGCILALDPVASVFSVFGFAISVLLTRYVSLGSILGGLIFLAAHFIRLDGPPFGADQRALTLLLFALMGLIVVRHRKNLARIAAGTEPRVSLRKRKGPPSGRVRIGLIAVLIALGAGTGLVVHAARHRVVTIGGQTLSEVARISTGQQRADRLAFADRGRLLAVTCPRYLRVVLIGIGDDGSMAIVKSIALDARPVAIAAAADRIYVLQRPQGDARHLEEAYWETFSFQGDRIGQRFRVGWDPDDLALSADGAIAYVLRSGSAEGETNRPPPSLIAIGLASDPPRPLGQVAFDGPTDDPERLVLVGTDRIAVSLKGPNQVARIDRSDPGRLRLIDRIDLPAPCVPESLVVGSEGRLLVGDPEAPGVWRLEGDRFASTEMEDGIAGLVGAGDWAVASLPKGSGLAIISGNGTEVLGRLPLRGTANLARTRPLGLAHEPVRGLLAVANRAGGSVHLVRIGSASPEDEQADRPVLAR